jgi:hypothetical protein
MDEIDAPSRGWWIFSDFSVVVYSMGLQKARKRRGSDPLLHPSMGD